MANVEKYKIKYGTAELVIDMPRWHPEEPNDDLSELIDILMFHASGVPGMTVTRVETHTREVEM